MRKLPAVIPSALLLAVVSCSAGVTPGDYEENDLQLITGYTAKELCSCLFVMEQDEDFCRRWVEASPAVASASVDFGAKTVTSGALLLWGKRARFVGPRFGCALE